jgi:hypothetical protein
MSEPFTSRTNVDQTLRRDEHVSTASEGSLFSVADFPVSHIRLLVDVPEPTTSATSGLSSPDSFASLDPDGSWRKTCQGYSQVTLDGSLARFSETWPRAGMTRNGIAYQRPPSAPLTDGTASGSWPTPQAQMAKHGAATAWEIHHELNESKRINLHVAVALWPTMTARDFRSPGTPARLVRAQHESSRGQPLTEMVGGQLNPTWVEWLMGYPLGWTVLEDSAIASCRRSRSGSRGELRKRKT